MNFSSYKKIGLIFLIVLFIILTYIFLQFQAKNQFQKIPNITIPTPIKLPMPTVIVPKLINDVPTISEQNGDGADLNSPIVKNSESEIQKILPYLPYSKEYTLSTGIPVSVFVGAENLQNDNWSLVVIIDNINYQTSPQDSDYSIMRKSFLEASNDLLSWIKSINVDPQKIIIKWGGRQYVQDISNKWLELAK